MGTWRLVEHSQFGASAQGLLLYHPNGSMAVVITGRLSKKGKAEESVIAYAGRYRVEGAIVVHDPTVSDDPARIGAEQKRFATLRGGMLILSETRDLAKGLVVQWQRV